MFCIMIDLAPHALHHLLLAHICLIYPLGHVYVEPKSEIQVEQVQKEYGGPQAPSARILILLLDQGKPRCIPPINLGFSFKLDNYVLLDCAFKFIGIE
jgi:hypothetical protein